VVFGVIYLFVMSAMNALALPGSFLLGLGLGLFHGLIISYALMFYASERHPLEDYRKATLPEGALHFLGHIILGGVTGLPGGAFVGVA
jgi:hypothetical protein